MKEQVRKYFDFPGIRVMLANNYKDTEGMHTHKKMSQIIYVIKGEVWVFYKDTTMSQILNSGEILYIPPNIWHDVSAKEGTKMLVLKYHSDNSSSDEIKGDYVK